MQKYRLSPNFFTQGFPVLYSGNGQERQQQITDQLIVPRALPNTQMRFSVVFEQACKGDYAACMAIIQRKTANKDAARVTFTCADCVFYCSHV